MIQSSEAGLNHECFLSNWIVLNICIIIYIMEKVLAILKDELGELYEEFIEIMRKDNVIITGSFILNVLTNRNYKNSDIDIYTQLSTTCDDIKSIYQSYHKSAGAKTTYTDLYYYLTLCDI